MALIALAPGEVGAVVTYLAMSERPPPDPLPASDLRLEPWRDPSPARYRALFKRVGAPWLWFSRLALDDAALIAAIDEVHAVIDRSGSETGLIELDFAGPEECLIRFLGLAPELAGKGHGKWLFAQVLRLAWRDGVRRVRVHTCTLDHPGALPAYLKAGFKAEKRAFESFPDPRLAGLLPAEAAPNVPMISGGF